MQPLVADLLNRGHDVWLIGSRVNPTATPPRDWDIVVFGNPELLEEIRARKPINDLDILIVVDGDHFESPWPRASDNVTKEGSLSNWKWRPTDIDSVVYEGTKWPHDWGSPKRGVRIKADAA